MNLGGNRHSRALRYIGMNIKPSPGEQAEHFISLLKKFHTAMLVTHLWPQGIHPRPMAIAKVEDDGRIWFFTGADTAKVHEIEEDHHVHIIAQEGDSAFLSLSGRAVLIGERPQDLPQNSAIREVLRIGNDQSREFIAIMPGNDDVAHIRRRV